MTSRELRKIREARGETQAQFATVLGVKENTVWRWENGFRPVSHPFPTLIRALVTAPEVFEQTA